jgi:mono/diheme cytochrome c family protein
MFARHVGCARPPARRAWILGVTLVALLAACERGDRAGASSPESGALAGGEELYAMHCAACHGGEGQGTAQGPPLVHEIYEPAHHPDASFLAAVRRGVDAHHWSFGPMPPLPAVSDEQVEEIVAYVRALQREAGIE